MKSLGRLATIAAVLSLPGCGEVRTPQKPDAAHQRLEKNAADSSRSLAELLLEEKERQEKHAKNVTDAQENLDQPKVADGFPGRLHALVNAREASQQGDSVKAIGHYTHAIVMILEDMANIEEKEHPSAKEQEEYERLSKQFDIVVAERKQQFEKLSAEQKGAAVREVDKETRVTNLRKPWIDPLVYEYRQKHPKEEPDLGRPPHEGEETDQGGLLIERRGDGCYRPGE